MIKLDATFKKDGFTWMIVDITKSHAYGVDYTVITLLGTQKDVKCVIKRKLYAVDFIREFLNPEF